MEKLSTSRFNSNKHEFSPAGSDGMRKGKQELKKATRMSLTQVSRMIMR